MIFRSFYTRIIIVLAAMSLTLFIILASINTYVFRNEIVKTFAELEKPRAIQLFKLLDEKTVNSTDPEIIQSILDSIFIEFNLDIFDKHGNWIAGKTSDATNLVSSERSLTRTKSPGFGVMSYLYNNPNENSPFRFMKLEMKLKNTPILNSMIIFFFLSGIISIMVSAIVGWSLSKYLNKRLNRLTYGVNKVAAGDFDFKLEEKGADEIAFLARKFNYMSEQLKKTITQLNEVNEARQRLIAHASHEIKSPLTSLKGFIDILEFTKALPEEQQKSLLPVVKRDLNRVIKIANDMLQLAKIRSPEYQFEYKKIDINQFLIEEHSHFAHKASSQKVTAIFESRINNNLQIKTDPERLSQILDNLWSNALKYGDHDFPIITKVFLEGKNLVISLTNHLVEPLNYPVERLFEPFYRDPGTSEKFIGSGLGLAIVKELAEKLQGKVTAQKDSEKIEIRLDLPLAEN